MDDRPETAASDPTPMIGRLIGVAPGPDLADVAMVLKIARKHYRDCLLAGRHADADEAASAIANVVQSVADLIDRHSIDDDDESA